MAKLRRNMEKVVEEHEFRLNIERNTMALLANLATFQVKKQSAWIGQDFYHLSYDTQVGVEHRRSDEETLKLVKERFGKYIKKNGR